MKKIGQILVLLAYCCGISALAQSDVSWRVGLQGGINLARFLEPDGNYNRYLPTYRAGIIIKRRLTKSLSVVGGVAFSRQGNIVKVVNPSSNYQKVVSRYDYVAAPIALQYKVKRQPFLLNAGLEFGKLIKNETEFLPLRGYTNNQLPFLRRTDIGWLAGLKYYIGKRIAIETRYYRSLYTLFKPTAGVDPVTGQFVSLPPIERYNQLITGSAIFYFN